METIFFGLKFEPMCTKGTCQSYADGRDQDDLETQHDRLSTQEQSNSEKCKKIPTSFECVCCHEIQR